MLKTFKHWRKTLQNRFKSLLNRENLITREWGKEKASCNANSKLFVSRFCPLNFSLNLVQYEFNFIKISLVELFDKLTYYPLSHKKETVYL